MGDSVGRDTVLLSEVPRKDRVNRTRHNNTRAVGKLKTAEMEPVSLRGQAVSKSTSEHSLTRCWQ